jgi:TPR repeat protein
MPEENESGPSSRQNPLLWLALLVVGLIVYVLMNGERGASMSDSGAPDSGAASGSIERSLLLPPGMRAREYIDQLRSRGRPYPLDEVYDKAHEYLREGNLADAHLMYFFAAREDHLPSIMAMGEMSDPTLFSAENALLDHADAVQAYKWYRKAASLGQESAEQRLDDLRQWANDEAANGDPEARQFLLNFQ